MPIAVRTESGFCRRNKESRNFKVITMSRYGSSPPKLGGVAAHQEISRSLLCWRGRGGSPAFWNHPVCAVSERDLFLNGAATPPNLGGEFQNRSILARRRDRHFPIQHECVKPGQNRLSHGNPGQK